MIFDEIRSSLESLIDYEHPALVETISTTFDLLEEIEEYHTQYPFEKIGQIEDNLKYIIKHFDLSDKTIDKINIFPKKLVFHVRKNLDHFPLAEDGLTILNSQEELRKIELEDIKVQNLVTQQLSKMNFFQPARPVSSALYEAKEKPPNEFLCPIHLCIMNNPVTTFPSGHSYDYVSLHPNGIRLLKDPVTRQPIKKIVHNTNLKNLIQQWLENHPHYLLQEQFGI